MNHAPTIWLTGLSAAGKTTLANALAAWFRSRGRAVCVMDGDRVRKGLSQGLGFDSDDRIENIRRTAEVARLVNESGIIVVASLISPQRSERLLARDTIGSQHFHEVYLCAPLSVCESRDPKGLYRQARAGALSQFAGVSLDYEPPEAAVTIDSSCLSIDESLTMCIRLLNAHNF